MPKQECEPLECQAKAKELVAEHIDLRYEERLEYDVYVSMFTSIGLSWKAFLSTTLPNSGFFTVEYYALKDETTLKAYAMIESITKY